MGNENNLKQTSIGVDVIPEKVSMYDTEELAKNSGAKKKSFFEKLGLIEPVDQENDESAAPEPQQALSEVKRIDNSESETVSKTVEYPIKNSEQNNRIEKLSIDEIYTIFTLLPRSATNTVYLIDNFLKALPNNLPIEIKRQSLDSLLAASHINMTDLLNDGKERIEIMNDYLNNFTLDLEEVISNHEKQIKELNEKIAHHNNIIEERSRTLEEQKAIVKFEVQKISSIIDFARSKDI